MIPRRCWSAPLRCSIGSIACKARVSRIDWPALIRFKRSFPDPFPKAREDGFKKAGIKTFHGHARFVDSTSVQVGDERLESKHVVIATGPWPARLNIPGEEHLTRSDQFLDLDELPTRPVFIGGGISHLNSRTLRRVPVRASLFCIKTIAH